MAPRLPCAARLDERGLIGTPYLVTIEIYGTQDVDIADNEFYSKCDDFLTVQWNTHVVDLMRSWTGRDAKRVLARTGRMNGQNFLGDQILTSVAEFGEGLTGHILHAELLRSSMSANRCRVEGDAARPRRILDTSPCLLYSNLDVHVVALIIA